jgi:hypothetical protein
MKMKVSPLVGELSGSLGDMTVQRSRAGLIVRGAPRAKGRVTGYRELRRSVFAAGVRRWQDLDPATRAAWGQNLSGAVGYGLSVPLKPLTAYSYFVAQWCIDSVCAGRGFDSPPKGGEVRTVGDAGVAVTRDPFAFVVTFTPTLLSDDEALVVAFTTFASEVSNVGGERWWVCFSVGAGVQSPFDLAYVLARFADIMQPGRAIGVRLSIYGTVSRRLCRPAFARTVVVA